MVISWRLKSVDAQTRVQQGAEMVVEEQFASLERTIGLEVASHL